MQPSGLQHQKRKARVFENRTPRDPNVSTLRLVASDPEMMNHTAMAFGAGPSYTNAIMGQGPSAAEREHARKASSTILREDSIVVEESENVSLQDSFSMHYNCTTQVPYCTVDEDDIAVREDLKYVAKDSDVFELNLFLRTSVPTPMHRRARDLESKSRAMARKRKALPFLKLKQRSGHFGGLMHEESCPELRDEGGLLAAQPIPKGYEQKISSTGQKYLALQEPEQDTKWDRACPLQSPSVLESRVSISSPDAINPSISPDRRKRERSVEDCERLIHPAYRKSYDFGATDVGAVIGAINRSSTPVRPPASDPPTPEPQSAISVSESLQSDLTERPWDRSTDTTCVAPSYRRYSSTSSSVPLPHAFDKVIEVPIQQPWTEKDVDIVHPCPRRLASHTSLLQRRSSTVASYRQSISDSPAPPPRSPLRLQRDAKNIEDILTSHRHETSRSKVAPVIREIGGYRRAIQPIRPTVITDCTGPIKRPKSRGSNVRGQSPHLNTRREREDRTRARKIRDRPFFNISAPLPTRAIDAIIHAPGPAPRHRLKKARPHIQIPDLKPAPLAIRAPSSASSNASWKKITENTRTPVSAVPSGDIPVSSSYGETTGYTPISPTASGGSGTGGATIALSPVMLVAEEVPIPKAKSPPKPARLVVRETKSYAPRPRSASIPRNAMKRRSRHGVQTPSTPGSSSPVHDPDDDAVPPLPPLIGRVLPPTPPASVSEGSGRIRVPGRNHGEKKLPLLPSHTSMPRLKDSAPHVVGQAMMGKGGSSRVLVDPPDINARLEALEKNNELLLAALDKVLKANGAFNGPIHRLIDTKPREDSVPSWATRVTRRNAMDREYSISKDNAMRLHHNTRGRQ